MPPLPPQRPRQPLMPSHRARSSNLEGDMITGFSSRHLPDTTKMVYKKILSVVSKKSSTVSEPVAAHEVFSPPLNSRQDSSLAGPTLTSTPSPINRVSSISQYLDTIKEILQDATSDTDIAMVHVLEQNTLEVLRLIRYRRNMLAPINRIPPEVLTLIADFWNEDARARATIALTHVCQAWREIFILRSPLWSDVYRGDVDKTHVNIDCSGSAPVNAWLTKYRRPLGRLQVIPHAVAQLKSVVVHGTAENLQEITVQLSHPAPLLGSLRIEVDSGCSPEDGPAIAATLFNGDLSSLRELCLRGIRTQLPWRNMINLMSFTLGHARSGEFPVKYLLDFLESAPHLHKIQLHHATPTFDGQTGRLVPLRCLKRMTISGWQPPSLLFNHLLIPGNAKLTTQVDLRYSFHIPRSFDTIRALTGFTIHMHVAGFHPTIQFSGSDEEISIIPATPQATLSCRVLESLALFDPSQVERLRLAGGDLMVGNCAIGPALWVMTHLRTLTISRCKNLSDFIPHLGGYAMCPCPELEELIIDPRVGGERFDIQRVVAMAVARASKGARLKSIRIVSRDKFVQACALELKEHVSHVECSPRVALVSDDIDSGDEED